MKRSKNRFDVQVQLGGMTFGMKNRTDVDLSPEDVASALEKFCTRIRNGGKFKSEPTPAADAVGLSEE